MHRASVYSRMGIRSKPYTYGAQYDKFSVGQHSARLSESFCFQVFCFYSVHISRSKEWVDSSKVMPFIRL